MDVIVIDNFLSAVDFDRLKLGMLGDAEFPWYFSNGVVSPTDHTDFLTNYQFTHLFYDRYKPNSEYYPYLESILKTILNRTYQLKNSIEWSKFIAGYS